MGGIVATPLIETEWAGVKALPDGMKSVHWCWTLAHYEEYLQTLRWMVGVNAIEERNGLHIAHCHKYAEPCNERCMLLDTRPISVVASGRVTF